MTFLFLICPLVYHNLVRCTNMISNPERSLFRRLLNNCLYASPSHGKSRLTGFFSCRNAGMTHKSEKLCILKSQLAILVSQLLICISLQHLSYKYYTHRCQTKELPLSAVSIHIMSPQFFFMRSLPSFSLYIMKPKLRHRNRLIRKCEMLLTENARSIISQNEYLLFSRNHPLGRISMLSGWNADTIPKVISFSE